MVSRRALSIDLRLAYILEHRLMIWMANDSTAYFDTMVKPVLQAMAKLGYSMADAVEVTTKLRFFRGTVWLATEAAEEEALLRASVRTGEETALKVASSLGGTMDVIMWAFMLAAPAGAEGLRDPDNQLAYKHYLQQRLGLFIQVSRYGGSHHLEPPLIPARWYQSLVSEDTFR